MNTWEIDDLSRSWPEPVLRRAVRDFVCDQGRLPKGFELEALLPTLEARAV
jgi:hypothetical protein